MGATSPYRQPPFGAVGGMLARPASERWRRRRLGGYQGESALPSESSLPTPLERPVIPQPPLSEHGDPKADPHEEAP